VSIINSERHKCKSLLSDKISTNAAKRHQCPTLYIARKYVLPAQPTNKRLSSSRNSIPLPLPSLSITDFVALHSTTHAITSIRGHVRTAFVHFHCRITSPRRIKSLRFWLGSIFLYSRASIADWLALGAIALACPNLVAKKRGPVWRLVC